MSDIKVPRGRQPRDGAAGRCVGPRRDTSLRQRFGIEARNSAIASRLLKEVLAAGVVRLEDAEAAPKMRRYVPHRT